jgi:hypothetical protein
VANMDRGFLQTFFIYQIPEKQKRIVPGARGQYFSRGHRAEDRALSLFGPMNRFKRATGVYHSASTFDHFNSATQTQTGSLKRGELTGLRWSG